MNRNEHVVVKIIKEWLLYIIIGEKRSNFAPVFTINIKSNFIKFKNLQIIYVRINKKRSAIGRLRLGRL